MKLLRGVYQRTGYSLAAFVLVLSTVTTSVPFIFSERVGAVGGAQNVSTESDLVATVESVASEAELVAALKNKNIETINLTASFSVANSVVVNRTVAINGNGHTITGPSLSGWVSGGNNYVLKVWNAGLVTITNIKLTGSNVAVLVSGTSSLSVRNGFNVSGNAFGGIEVTKGGHFGLGQGHVTDTTEAYGKPAIWVDGQGTVGLRKNVEYTAVTYVKTGQTQYYINKAVSGIAATNVNTGVAYDNLEKAIDAATAGDTIRIEQDLTLTSPTVRVRKAVTIDGNGKTVSTTQVRSKNGTDNATFIVLANDVTIKDVTTRGVGGSNAAHGVVFQNVTGAVLENVALQNGAAGVIVNGSEVTATGITTSGNSWGGVNVDRAGAKYTLVSGSSSDEPVAIWTESPSLVNITVPAGQYARIAQGSVVSYMNDASAPSVSVSISPLVGGVYANGNAVSVTANISDDTGLNQGGFGVYKAEHEAKLRATGAPHNQLRVAVTGWPQNDSINNLIKGKKETSVTRSLDTSLLADGDYVIRVGANDNADKVGYDIVKFTVDKTAPEAPVLLSPTSGASENGGPRQTWSHIDLADVDHFIYESYSDEDLTKLIHSSNVKKATSRAIGGTQTINLWWRIGAVDKAGNVSWSDAWYLSVDNTAPEAPSVVESNSRGIGGLAEAGSTVSIEIVGNTYTVVADEFGAWAIEFDPVLTEGTYQYTVSSTDKAGNRSELLEASVTVLPPVVGVVDPEVTLPVNNTGNNNSNGNVTTSANSGSGVLGASDVAQVDTAIPAVDSEEAAVRGATTDNAAQAVSSSEDEAVSLLGLAWYWWLIIVAAVALALWWLLAALRRRKSDEQ